MRRAAFVAALVAAAGLLAVVLAWRFGGPRAPAPGAAPARGSAARGSPAGDSQWMIVAGSLASEGEKGAAGGATRLRAVDEAVLKRDGITLTAAPGSLLELPAHDEGDDGVLEAVLPEVLEGTLRIESAAPFLARGILFEPRGRTSLELTSNEVHVVEGTITLGGGTYGPGSVIPRGLADTEKAGSGGDPGSTAETPAHPVGQVVDAETGAPLSGVDVWATYSHSDDGYPPLPRPGSRRRVRTDSRGDFYLPEFLPEDPRLKLHLEVDHPDYLPAVHVVEEAPDLEGRWPFTTLWLRRGVTARVLLLDPEGNPLRGAAVQVAGEDPDSFIGEDAWGDGRTVRPDRPVLIYTRNDGTVRAPRRSVLVELRHPYLHLWDVHQLQSSPGEVLLLPDARRAFMVNLSPDGRARWEADPGTHLSTRYGLVQSSAGGRAGGVRRYLLVDADNAPLVESLIEITLDEMPTLRLYTDEEGGFLLEPRPYGKLDPRGVLSPESPRSGTLTVLSPLFWKVKVDVAFPMRAEILRLPGRQAGRLAFSLAEAVEAGAGPAVSAEGVRIDADLTLVLRAAGGQAVYHGALPRGGSQLELSARGYLPEVIVVPPHPLAAPELDLGAIALRRGGTMRVRATGALPDELRRGRLFIAERDRSDVSQEYRLDARGEAVVGGLREGVSYVWALEGSRLERVEGELLATPELFRDGLEIPLESEDEAEVSLSAHVDGLRLEETLACRVVERYYPLAQAGPLICMSYPLAPDGRLGSRRVLPRTRRAEVFVVGPGHRVGYAARDAAAESQEFELGRVMLRDSYHAFFTFSVPGLPSVGAPNRLELVADENRNHEIARMWQDGRTLAIENLWPGQYHLRWGGEGQPEGVFTFRVRPSDLELRADVPRQAAREELVEIDITDGEEKPAERAELLRGVGEAWEPLRAAAVGGGRYRLPVRTLEENRFRISHPDHLLATLTLPPSGALPERIVLRKGARARAQIKDAAGRYFEGNVVVSFAPEIDAEAETTAAKVDAAGSRLPAAVLVHGEPLAVAVEKGQFLCGRVPPGAQRVKIRDSSSEAMAEGVYALADGRLHDLGRLVLAETRSMSGVVLLPDGRPAAKVTVGLWKPDGAYRFPQRSNATSALEYSARADAVGRFRIDGLPLDLRGDLALIAHLPGYTDAIESPVDLSDREHELYLGLNTQLVIDAGYPDSQGWEDYRFTLQYFPDAGAEPVQVGPWAPQPPGGRVYEGITPGIYRMLWGLVDAHPALGLRLAEAQVMPGEPAALALRPAERIVTGEAVFNGRPLEKGWVVFLADPSRPDEASIGRVKDGLFRLPMPLRAESGYASLIPERDPLPMPRFEWGQALPREVRDLRGMLRRRHLTIHYEAYDLTIKFPAELLSRHADLQIEFPHYGPSGGGLSSGGYRKETRAEPIDSTTFRLSLLPPGPFAFKVSSRGGSRYLQSVDLQRDMVIPIDP